MFTFQNQYENSFNYLCLHRLSKLHLCFSQVQFSCCSIIQFVIILSQLGVFSFSRISRDNTQHIFAYGFNDIAIFFMGIVVLTWWLWSMSRTFDFTAAKLVYMFYRGSSQTSTLNSSLEYEVTHCSLLPALSRGNIE